MRPLLRILSLGLLFLPFYVSSAEKAAPESIAGTTRVTAEAIFDLYDQHDDLIIIDSRKASDRAGGYIEGSIALPDTLTTPVSLAENIPSKSNEVVFYCNGPKCGRSVKAAKIAVAEGYTNVYWFRGGWGEWETKGYPVAK